VKKIKKIAILLFAIIFLIPAFPASASGTSSTIFPFGGHPDFRVVKQIGNHRVIGIFVLELNIGGVALEGWIWNEDGSFYDGYRFDEGTSVADFTFSDDSFTLLKNGGMAFSWMNQAAGSPNTTSSLNFSYSTDGREWSETKNPVPVHKPDPYNCGNGCGYSSPVLAVDGSGTLAMAYTLVTNSRNNSTSKVPVNVVTTNNLKTWSSPRSVNSTVTPSKANFVRSLIGLPQGGFLVTWLDQIIDIHSYGQIYAATLGKGKKVFGSVAISLRASPEEIMVSELVTQDQGKLTYLIAYLDENYRTNIDFYNYDAKTATVGAKTGLLLGAYASQVQSQLTYWKITKKFKLVNSLGNTSIVMSAENDIRTNSQMFKIDFASDGSTPVITKPFDFVVYDGSLLSAFIGSDDSVHVLYSSGLAGIRLGKILNNQLVAGDQLPIARHGDFIHAAANDQGRLMVFDQPEWLGPAKIFSFSPESAPIATSHVKLSGTAKTKQILTATAASFTNTEAAGQSGYRWYRCESAVGQISLQLSSGCELIPNASTKKYKLVTADKGKYLVVSNYLSNQTGSTSSFSKSTAKVK
jgi:hypothetical protein